MNGRYEVEHVPVLLGRFLEATQPVEGEFWLDATFGRGGYSLALLERGCRVWALDQDEEAARAAKRFEVRWGNHFCFYRENFRMMKKLFDTAQIPKVDGVIMDLGLSSPQIASAERGFSFMEDGPLDMRMDQRQKLTAEEVLNTWSEESLREVIAVYGGERHARTLARAIVRRRKLTPWKRTRELAQLACEIVKTSRASRIHPATRLFQAIRIAVNDELGALREGLEGAVVGLKPGGRLAVISFHSGEDRLVKHFMRHHHASYAQTREGEQNGALALFSKVERWLPDKNEIRDNSRCRSARLRIAYKIGGKYE